jgi:hypothetical protein
MAFTEFEDAFIGLGTIEKTFEPFELEVVERQMCVENTFSKKIVFGKLVKFLPELPINDNQISSLRQRVPLLHQRTDFRFRNTENRKLGYHDDDNLIYPGCITLCLL